MLSRFFKRDETGPSESGSREITSYLRGLAIVSVVINHYAYVFLSDEFLGYANGIVSIFLVLAGYGAFYSWQKYGKVSGPAVLSYYASRAMRIFPLYWISLGLWSIYGRTFSITVYLALPLKAEGGEW